MILVNKECCRWQMESGWLCQYCRGYCNEIHTNILTVHFRSIAVKVAGNHVNEIHDFCMQLNFSRLGCLCRRRFSLRFACLLIDIEHGKF